MPLGSTAGFDLAGDEEARTGHVERAGSGPARVEVEPEVAEVVQGRGLAAVLPQSRLRLHDGSSAWPSTTKNRLSAVPELSTDGLIPNSPTPAAGVTGSRAGASLEQRAEQLSRSELERLAALVERRLDRVRGAPPQYQATEGV